jgi:hypothetical protein
MHLAYTLRALPDSQKPSESCYLLTGTSTRRAATMATLSKQSHMEATKRLYDCCWTRERTSTHKAAATASLSKQPQVKVMKRLCHYFGMLNTCFLLQKEDALCEMGSRYYHAIPS